MGCSRKRLSNNDEFHPEGRKLSTRLISTVPSQEIPKRCLSDSISRSRWLSTGQTGTHEPHITHSSVKRATCGKMSSEMVARLRSAMLTVADMGTGQARIQRSQPMHMSISKRTSSSLNGRRPARCSMPTSGASFFDDLCIAFFSPDYTLCSRRYCLPYGQATIHAETRFMHIRRATVAALNTYRDGRLNGLRAGLALHADEVKRDAAYGDAVAMRKAIGIIDLRGVHHHTVDALHVANIIAIG